jgi:hypothetical protein
MDFSYEFLVALNVFHQCFVKVNTNFTKAVLSKKHSEAFLYHRMVARASKKSIG